MESNNQTECSTEEVIKSNEFFRYVLIPAILIAIGLSFSRTRKKICPGFLSGNPGVFYPWNCIEAQTHRSGIVAFHVVSATCVIELIQGNLVIFEIPDLDHSTRVIINAIFLGLAFYPIISLLTYDQMLGLLLGSLYTWSFTISYFLFSQFPCNESLNFHITAKLPFYICLLYLVLIFPYNFFRKLFDRSVVTDHSSPRPPPPQVRYIKHIFQKSKQTSKYNSKIAKIINWLDTKRYHSIPGFRYSPRILSCVAVGAVSVHEISMMVSGVFVIDLLPLCNPEGFDFLKQVIETGVLQLFLPNANLSTNVIDFAHFQCISIIGISIFTVVFCELLFLLICVHILSTYRNNLLSIYRGNYENIPRFTNARQSKIVNGFIKFAGFQTFTLISGYTIQSVVIWIVLFLLLELIITPIKFGYYEFLWSFFIYLIPIMISAFLTILLEVLVIRLVFLHKKTLTNRRIFFNYVYFTYYFNIIKGIFSTLIRLIKAIIFGLSYLPRLDNSCLSRRFEMHDSGFVAYINFLKMENQHTNPILLVFVHLWLLQSAHPKNSSNDKRSGLSRRRWLLAFTLLNNPGLILKRKPKIANGDHMVTIFNKQQETTNDFLVLKTLM